MSNGLKRYREDLLRSPIGAHLFVETTRVRTTWTFRLLLFLSTALFVALTAKHWLRMAGESLVHETHLHPAETILIENLDQKYLPFQEAGRLQREGMAARVFVPILVSGRELAHPRASVPVGVANFMIRAATINGAELVPIRLQEPISLNAARQLKDYLVRAAVHSVIVVTWALRSTRTFLVYRHVLQPAGIQVQVAPVFGDYDAQNWTKSLHGIQEVILQLGKLWYYRLFVL